MSTDYREVLARKLKEVSYTPRGDVSRITFKCGACGAWVDTDPRGRQAAGEDQYCRMCGRKFVEIPGA